MSTAQIGGISVGYDDTGAGTPLVLVHGHPFDRSMWRPQTERFGADGWRVIAPDLRGYGATTVVPGVTPLEVFAGDIAGLLDHLGIERFALAGLSMGGQIALELYRLVPHRIRALVLADTFPEAETAEGKRRRNEVADRLLRDGMAGYADEQLPKMVAQSTIEARPEVARHVLTMMRNAPAEGAAAALRGRAERRDYVDLLGRIDVPTLVLVGSDDEYTPVEWVTRTAGHIPGAELVVIDDAGHLPNLERPDEFDLALAEFLKPMNDGADAR